MSDAKIMSGAREAVKVISDGELDIVMRYTNYHGETSARTIRPVSLSFRSTEYHPEPQWILRAMDMDKMQVRDFALRDADFTVLADQERKP